MLRSNPPALRAYRELAAGALIEPRVRGNRVREIQVHQILSAASGALALDAGWAVGVVFAANGESGIVVAILVVAVE